MFPTWGGVLVFSRKNSRLVFFGGTNPAFPRLGIQGHFLGGFYFLNRNSARASATVGLRLDFFRHSC